MKSCLKSWFACVLLGVSASAIAQVSTGTPPLGSFSSGPDVIVVSGRNLEIDVRFDETKSASGSLGVVALGN
jgi:hypothetical protein